MNKPSTTMANVGAAALADAANAGDSFYIPDQERSSIACAVYRAMERQRMHDERRARQEASARRKRLNVSWDYPDPDGRDRDNLGESPDY